MKIRVAFSNCCLGASEKWVSTRACLADPDIRRRVPRSLCIVVSLPRAERSHLAALSHFEDELIIYTCSIIYLCSRLEEAPTRAFAPKSGFWDEYIKHDSFRSLHVTLFRFTEPTEPFITIYKRPLFFLTTATLFAPYSSPHLFHQPPI